MQTLSCDRNTKTGALACALFLAMSGGILLWRPGSARAAPTDADGVISGTITVDCGMARAFRVKAKDTARRITYTVYTNKGQYHIYNLPASHYEVQVMEEGIESEAAG